MDFGIQIFADGADLQSMERLAGKPWISGFTTNPSLLKKAGVKNYEQFAHEAVSVVRDKPISFEVLAEEPKEIERQAQKIADWGPNVFVKIPIANTKGQSNHRIIESLSPSIPINVTACLTHHQIYWALLAVRYSNKSYISVFAGRIADTGKDPAPMFQAAVSMRYAMLAEARIHLLWASARSVGDILLARQAQCNVITLPTEILARAEQRWGTDLEAYARETVQQFYEDSAGYVI